MWPVLGILGLGGFAILLTYQALDVAHPTADLKPGCRGPSNPMYARIIAEKWAGLFKCPVETMMVIAKIESGFRPECANFNMRALSRGGAFGMWQQTLKTAKGHAAQLASHPSADVQATLRKWTGDGRCLIDADLCGLFAAKHLGELTAMFKGDLAAVAGAYHQGAGKVRQVLAQGGTLPASLPPKGKYYVTRALAAKGTV